MSIATAVSRVQELSTELGLTPASPAPATPAAETPAASPTRFSRHLAQAQSVPADYQPMIERAARHWGVPADLITAVIQQESGFDPNATSPAGAQGLMQLMPSTAQGLGVTDPYDPEQSIWGGAHELSTQLQRFGDVRLALAAYNAGSGAVSRYGGVPPYPETQNYVRQVMDRYLQLQGGT
jgi:soluble lytic murein transglycosylase-like protein